MSQLCQNVFEQIMQISTNENNYVSTIQNVEKNHNLN